MSRQISRAWLLTYLDNCGIQTFVGAIYDQTGTGLIVYFADQSEIETAAQKVQELPEVSAVVIAELSRPVLQVTFKPERGQ